MRRTLLIALVALPLSMSEMPHVLAQFDTEGASSVERTFYRQGTVKEESNTADAPTVSEPLPVSSDSVSASFEPLPLSEEELLVPRSSEEPRVESTGFSGMWIIIGTLVCITIGAIIFTLRFLRRRRMGRTLEYSTSESSSTPEHALPHMEYVLKKLHDKSTTAPK